MVTNLGELLNGGWNIKESRISFFRKYEQLSESKNVQANYIQKLFFDQIFEN